MDNEEVEARQRLDNAKASLTEKLAVLEETVADTVEKVSDPVAETAEAVKETVVTVKDTVEQTAEAVKDTVVEGMEAVRHWMDFSGHVQKYPWMMMAAGVGTGMCLEMVFGGSGETERAPATSGGHHGRAHHHNGGVRKERAKSSGISSWFGQFEPEVNKLKSMALSALLGAVRSMVVQAVPQKMQQGVQELFETASKKLGAEPPLELPAENEQQPQGERNGSNAKRKQSEVGRPMGSTRWPS
jgi:ElaB/YqjD/DUF883 family membrane-anchored ribosome-binding protein